MQERSKSMPAKGWGEEKKQENNNGGKWAIKNTCLERSEDMEVNESRVNEKPQPGITERESEEERKEERESSITGSTNPLQSMHMHNL